MAAIKPLEEIGRTGLNIFYGQIEERYLCDLYGKDGIKVFDQIRRRDPTIRSLLYATKLMARTSEWKVVAASDKGIDADAAQFLETCLGDMSHTVSDAIDDILSMLAFGWFWSEICYKRRQGAKGKHSSLFDDGKVGWRKWAPRRQTSWYKWEMDEAGGVQGMWQWPQAGKFEAAVLIPIEKSLHFTTEPDCGDPEGISLLESCYEHWYFLKNIVPMLGIGFERSFVGLPVFKFLEKPTSTDTAAVETMGKGLRIGDKAWVSTPPKVEFDLKSAQNNVAGDILETIKYFRVLMLQSALADYINLGSGATGSWSLGKDKSQLFLMAVNGWLDKIEAVLNRFAVPRLFGYNDFAGITALPQIQHTVVEKPDLAELGQWLTAIAGHITLEDEDVVWLRHRAGMPAIEEPTEAAPEPETGGDEEGETEATEGLGQALMEFAETPDAGAVIGVAAGALAERRAEMQAALTERQVVPPAVYWTAERKALTAALLPAIEVVVMSGAEAAVAELEAVMGIGVDWALINEAALEWARTYTFDLVKGVTETSRNLLQTQLANWVEAGEPLPKMWARLEPIYGPVRAEMIGTTEVTRAFAQGNELAWRESRVISGKEWHTAVDERVCFPAWTMVTTKAGRVPIQKIQPGALVQTRLGWRAIEAVNKSFYTGAMVEVKAGNHWVCATADHPFWTLEEGWLEGSNLERRHRLQASDKQAVRVGSILQFDVGDAADNPTARFQVGGLAGIPLAISMPVDAINLQGNAEIRQEKIDAVPAHLGFLDVGDSQGIKSEAGAFLRQGLALVGTIASKATKLAVGITWQTSEFFATIATGDVMWWSATFLGAKVTTVSLLRYGKQLATTLTGLIVGIGGAAFPTAKGVSIFDRYQHIKGFSALWAYLLNSLATGRIITCPTAKATAFSYCAGAAVDHLPAGGAGDFPTGSGRNVVTLPRTIDVFRDNHLRASKRFATLIADVFKRHGAQLLTKMVLLYHKLYGSAIPVYDIQVSGLPEFYANDLLVHNCPICGALHGEIVPIGQPFSGGIMNPPAHTNCRCWILPVVMKVKR